MTSPLLTRRTALASGAAQGIGPAIAARLAAAGARVVLHAAAPAERLVHPGVDAIAVAQVGSNEAHVAATGCTQRGEGLVDMWRARPVVPGRAGAGMLRP